jgi:hypothetical protein
MLYSNFTGCELAWDKMRIMHSRQQHPTNPRSYAPTINRPIRRSFPVIHIKEAQSTGSAHLLPLEGGAQVNQSNKERFISLCMGFSKNLLMLHMGYELLKKLVCYY